MARNRSKKRNSSELQSQPVPSADGTTTTPQLPQVLSADSTTTVDLNNDFDLKAAYEEQLRKIQDLQNSYASLRATIESTTAAGVTPSASAAVAKPLVINVKNIKAKKWDPADSDSVDSGFNSWLLAFESHVRTAARFAGQVWDDGTKLDILRVFFDGRAQVWALERELEHPSDTYESFVAAIRHAFHAQLELKELVSQLFTMSKLSDEDFGAYVSRLKDHAMCMPGGLTPSTCSLILSHFVDTADPDRSMQLRGHLDMSTDAPLEELQRAIDKLVEINRSTGAGQPSTKKQRTGQASHVQGRGKRPATKGQASDTRGNGRGKAKN